MTNTRRWNTLQEGGLEFITQVLHIKLRIALLLVSEKMCNFQQKMQFLTFL